MPISTGITNLYNFVEISHVINCFYTVEAIFDSNSMSHIQDFSNSEDNIADLVDVVKIFEFSDLNPLPEHLKYAYLDDHQQFPIIITNNLNQEQEEKLLNVLRKHKKAIGDQPLHLYAQDLIRGGSPTYKAATMKAESNHSRRNKERSHKITCSRDHLPYLRQPMGESGSSGAKEV
ncbi:hypothetical protein CR513_55983, partial [Mucuna pruriens]